MSIPSKSNLTSRITAAALAVLALCALVALAVLLLPGLRARVEAQNEQARFSLQANSANAAEKEDLLSDAKLVALSLNQYCVDNNKLPEPGSNLQAVLKDYNASDALASRLNTTTGRSSSPFVYSLSKPLKSFSGNDLPADVVAGYKEGALGKAIVYADSHVVWQDK